MREQTIIDEHLRVLQAAISWHPDHSELLAESRDHLFTRAEALESTERLPWTTAQRRAVEAFGTAEALARELARTRGGRLAIPRTATRVAGVAAVVGAALLMTSAGLVATMDLAAGFSEAVWGWWIMTTTLGLVGVGAAIAGMLSRLGAAESVTASATGVAFLWALCWPADWYAWLAATFVLMVPVALIVRRWQRIARHHAPGGWALIAAWPFGAAVFVTYSLFGRPEVDEYGFTLSLLWGVVAAFTLTSVGVADIGRHLLRERPAPRYLLPEPSQPTIAPNYFAPRREVA